MRYLFLLLVVLTVGCQPSITEEQAKSAFNEGRFDAKHGKRFEDNPHPEGSAQRLLWWDGHNVGLNDILKDYQRKNVEKAQRDLNEMKTRHQIERTLNRAIR